MSEYAYEVPCTFTCEPLLFVLGHMMSRSTTVRAPSARNATNAAHVLATETSRNVHVVDDAYLLVMMDEPFEAVSVARAHNLAPRRCIASGLALELVRESNAWPWLCSELQLDPRRSYQRGIVKLPDVGVTELPPDVGELPDGQGVWLFVLHPDGVQQLAFIDREHTIGRVGSGANVDIEIYDKRVSRQHATIKPFQGTWAIEDRASTSGTFFEGARIRSRCLMPGMVFRLGETTLVVLSVR
jgi:hypothetical protein